MLKLEYFEKLSARGSGLKVLTMGTSAKMCSAAQYFVGMI